MSWCLLAIAAYRRTIRYNWSFKKMIALSAECESLWKSELSVEVSSTSFCASVLSDVTADKDEDDIDVNKVVCVLYFTQQICEREREVGT